MGKVDRADLRFLERLAKLGGTEEVKTSTLVKASDLFTANGGSWTSVFQGDLDQIALLRKALKAVNEKAQGCDKTGRRGK